MSSPDGPQGLLIDYGGVLTNAIGPVMEAFCRSKGLPEDALAVLAGADSTFRPKLDAYERGEHEDTEFRPMFAAALGLAAQDLDGFLRDLRPDDRMFAAVAALRDHGIRVGLLSNSWGMSDYPLAMITDTFDGVVISGQVGMRKPEPSIYRHAAQTIGVEPRRCVFVDDTAGNVAVAVSLGMTVIHHERAEQTLRELERLFGVELEAAA
jgi:epoxide hydrolase-like predicted phosphatase